MKTGIPRLSIVTFSMVCLAGGFFSQSAQKNSIWLIPAALDDRLSLQDLHLTAIGTFGLLRKARPKIPAHLHTGIDIERPRNNYRDEPIYAASQGRVISLRDDGPYAQVIIEHDDNLAGKIWTVYEHLAGITVHHNQIVNVHTPIGRFMSKDELTKYGWQFDHLHFEVMKKKPKPLKPNKKNPYRFFQTYWLNCYTRSDLFEHYYHPMEFFQWQWSN